MVWLWVCTAALLSCVWVSETDLQHKLNSRGAGKVKVMNFSSEINYSHIVFREVQSSQKVQSQVNYNGEKEEAFV